MASVINGTNMVLKVDYSAGTSPVAIAAATSCTISITADAGEVTDKDSGDRKEFIGLSTTWTCDADAFYTEDGSSVPELYTLFDCLYGDATASQNGVSQYPTAVYITFDGGSDTYSGYGYLTSLTGSGGTEDAGTISISIQGTGQLTKS
tara:strand:- start:7964 stop:8410 length:447 start_codon:yes stop_codon:yes gene_type:complete